MTVEPVGDVRALLELLDGKRIPHMLVGGFALEAFGVPRATLDIDVQVDLAAPPGPETSTFLGWIIEERTTDPVFGQPVLILHRPTSPVPFELFLSTHWFTREALARRRTVKSRLVRRDVPVPRLEDFLLLKAAYMAAPSRSPRKRAQDGVDIESIVRTHRDAIDVDSVRRTGERLGAWAVLAGFFRP